MNLVDKIKTLYPTLVDEDFYPEGTIHLQNDSNGKGDYIKSWTNSNPQPTDTQLTAIGN